MKKRLSSLLLATSMVCALTACGGEDAKQTESSNSTSATETKEDLPQASDEIAKIGDGTVEFEFWTAMHPITSKHYKSLNEHPGAALLEEKTGVKVHYVSPTAGEEKKNLNLMLNDPSSLPDMFGIADFDSIYPGGTSGAIQDGILVDITEMVENYAPNFMKMINADEGLKKAVYNDDGVLTGFGTIIVNEEKRGSAMYGPIVNKVYLDEAGLDIPVTIDDWEEMLTKFKEMGVEYPLMFDIRFLKDCFSGAYGVQNRGAYFLDEEGKVRFGANEEGYKEFLTTMNRWYEKGLIDPDFATRAFQADVIPAFTNGKAGSYIGYVSDLKSTPINAAAQGNTRFEPVAVPYPVLKEGDHLRLRDFQENRTKLACYITTNAKDPVSIVRWMDQMYSLEGRRANTFGEEGVTYTIKDGKCVYTDLITNNPDGLNQTEAGRKYIFKDLFRTWEDDDHAQLYTEPSQYDAWEKWNQAGIEGQVPSTLVMTQEESDQFVQVSSQLDTYREEMQQKFIMGQSDIEKEWDSYCDTLESLGYKTAVECKQKAYDRYLER